MSEKETMKQDANSENEMEELDFEQLDKAAGGRGLRSVEKTKTHDIDNNTISRI